MEISAVFGAGFVVFILILIVIGVGSMALWVWGIIDAATRPDWVFERARSNKVLWIVLMAVVGAIAAVIYLLSVRPRLISVQESAQVLGWGQEGAYRGTPAGWYGDPSGRHRMRYWDGGAWTGSVWDGGQVLSDPLTH